MKGIVDRDILRCEWKAPYVTRLLELLQAEYVGLYGEPDPDENAGLDRLWYPNGDILVLMHRSQPLGLIAWDPHPERPEVALMRRTYVHFRARRQGLATRLVAAAEHSAREAGRTQMWLEHGTAQTAARALYISRGYVPELAEPYGHYAQFADTTSIFLGKELR